MGDTARARTRRAPAKAREASGRFVLRLPPGLHAALRASARDAGLSLNDLCLRKLATPEGHADHPAFATVLSRAAAVAGDGLAGVILFGSWARGTATASSDVDVLIVVEPSFALTRAAYRRWDAEPPVLDGRPVESHIVHLPASQSKITGVWAEVAIDGIVIFERGTRLSAWLSEVRRAIADGRIERRIVHGQPYWREVA